MAMLLANIGNSTVLKENVLSWSALTSDHIASPSSPRLRRKLLVTVTWLMPSCRLRPSAGGSRIRLVDTVSPADGPSRQRPTLTCWIHRSDTTEPPPSAPPMPLTWSQSLRSVTSPMIAKSYSFTLLLTPELPPWPQLLGSPRPNTPTR